MKILLKTFLLIYSFTNLILANTLTEETAQVTEIIDGDTIKVIFDNDSTNTEEKIRILGIQTTEINYYDTSKSDCYADEATSRMVDILGGVGTSVTLRSLHPEFRDINNRLHRYVFKTSNNSELDTGKQLVIEGLALPMEFKNEPTFSVEYNEAAQLAKQQKLGLWSTINGENHCPTTADSTGAIFEINLHYYTYGEENQNLTDEWLRIKNTSGRAVDISRWWLRDSALNFFRFPASTILEDNEEIIVSGGQGTNTSNKFYWGNTESIFSDINDGVYLLDYLDYTANDSDTSYSPKGNIKGAFVYPCFGTCTDSLRNKLKIVANYDAVGDDSHNINGEWIRISNISNKDINLKNHLLFYDALGSQHYIFRDNTILHQGEELYIYVGEGSDTRLKKYLNRTSPILANAGGRVWLTSFDTSIIVNDFSWPCTNDCTDALTQKIEIRVNYNALGDDSNNPNGEWISIINTSKGDIDLKDYLLHYDAKGSQHYFFDKETIIHKDEALYIYVGQGSNERLKKYIGRTSGILANAGGRAWLTTLDAVEVASFTWPCSQGCHYDAPLEIVEVNYDAQGNDATNPNGEWITIKNTSGTNINLRNWKVIVRSYHFNFIENKVLQPNDQIKIYMGSGNNGYYWGFDEGKLNNGGDVVKFLNPQRLLSHCYSWGSEANVCTNLLDSDNDGILNKDDSDDDGDNISDDHDDFPLSIHESIDTDHDGIGNNSDTDDDNDGISDQDEIQAGSDPLDPNSKPNFFVPIIAYLLY